jgi:hypothetical protein
MTYLAASIGLGFDWIYKFILFLPIKKVVKIMRSKIALDYTKTNSRHLILNRPQND